MYKQKSSKFRFIVATELALRYYQAWTCSITSSAAECVRGQARMLVPPVQARYAIVTPQQCPTSSNFWTQRVTTGERKMKTFWVPIVAIMFIVVSSTVPAGAPPKADGLNALEKKLLGAWIGQGGCDGEMVFQADGTYHVMDWTVGAI